MNKVSSELMKIAKELEGSEKTALLMNTDFVLKRGTKKLASIVMSYDPRTVDVTLFPGARQEMWLVKFLKVLKTHLLTLRDAGYAGTVEMGLTTIENDGMEEGYLLVWSDNDRLSMKLLKMVRTYLPMGVGGTGEFKRGKGGSQFMLNYYKKPLGVVASSKVASRTYTIGYKWDDSWDKDFLSINFYLMFSQPNNVRSFVKDLESAEDDIMKLGNKIVRLPYANGNRANEVGGVGFRFVGRTRLTLNIGWTSLLTEEDKARVIKLAGSSFDSRDGIDY